MALSINDYLIEADDDCRPLIPKPSLQQYDNYQIYDMVCVDVGYKLVRQIDNFLVTYGEELKLSWMAIQAFSPDIIDCDFIAIANTYK